MATAIECARLAGSPSSWFAFTHTNGRALTCHHCLRRTVLPYPAGAARRNRGRDGGGSSGGVRPGRAKESLRGRRATAAFPGPYTLSCHYGRHLIGGRLNHFAKHPIRYKAWTLASKLTANHMTYAWLSLVGVAATDFYVRLIATGAFHDPRFF